LHWGVNSFCRLPAAFKGHTKEGYLNLAFWAYSVDSLKGKSLSIPIRLSPSSESTVCARLSLLLLMPFFSIFRVI
jgi:hypothetical protein